MQISYLLKMEWSEVIDWLVENEHNIKMVDGEPMYNSVEDFEDIVGYKVNSSFNDGFRMARLQIKDGEVWM